MDSPSQRDGRTKHQGFTLVEIMIVVVIIGLLAALAIPAFQRNQRASQNARIVNDFRVFSQAFETYNAQNGAWPNNAGPGVVPTLPVPMTGDFRTASWTTKTAIGGIWNWDNSLASGGTCGVSISATFAAPLLADDGQLADIDAKLDDGNLSTGNFVKVSATRVTLILEQSP